MSEGPPQDLTHWLLGALATMATAVGALWKRNESKNAKALRSLESRLQQRNEKLDLLENHVQQCDRENLELRVAIARMESRLGVVETDHPDTDQQGA